MTSSLLRRYKAARAGAREVLLRSPLAPLLRRRYWVVDEPQPMSPRPIPDFRLFAILGTWMEEDIVEACVANAFEQGCEEVYLIDNGSTDDTVPRAVAAGAIPVGNFAGPFYDEHLRIHHMQSAAEYITSSTDAEVVWWLWLDADEFPRAPGSLTIRDFLSQLDRRFEVVGGRYLDHLPSEPIPERIVANPWDLIPLCVDHSVGPCFRKHRKHPLVRFDRGTTPPRMGSGFHRLDDVRGLIEPSTGIIIHHFPYRNRLGTLRRLKLLCAPVNGAARVSGHEDLQLGRESNSSRRLREFNDVYEQRWDQLALVQRFGEPRPYTEVLDVLA